MNFDENRNKKVTLDSVAALIKAVDWLGCSLRMNRGEHPDRESFDVEVKKIKARLEEMIEVK